MTELNSKNDYIGDRGERLRSKFMDKEYFEKYICITPYKEILDYLVKGPRTISEIYQDVSKTISTVSKVTMYRYVQQLVDSGLLEERGGRKRSQDTTMGAVKILYDRTATFYLPSFHEERIFKNESGNKSVFLLAKIIDFHLTDYISSLDELRIQVSEITEALNKLLQEIVWSIYRNSKLQSELLKTLASFDEKLTFFFYESLGIFYFLFKMNKLSLVSLKQAKEQEINDILLEPKDSLIDEASNSTNKQDLLDPEYIPEFIQAIDSKVLKKYFDDANYRAIIRLLLKKPMTLTEIFETHQQAVVSIKSGLTCEIKNDKVYVNNKERTDIQIPKKKSQKSIWRYLDELKQQEIIIEAGCRIDHQEGKRGPKTQLLYARKAFYFKEIIEIEKDWERAFTFLGKILGELLNLDFVEKEIFCSMLSNILKTKQYLIVDAFKDVKDKKIMNLISNYSFIEYNAFSESVDLVEWFVALEKNDIKTKLKNCFK